MTHSEQAELDIDGSVPVRRDTSVSPSATAHGLDAVVATNETAERDSGTPPTTTADPIPRAAATVAEQRLFFLTNRMNLNGVLSSRILAPREAFHKYYADLLARCPGWVPLLTAPPAPALIDVVVSEQGSGSPVIIEFPMSVSGVDQTGAPVVYVRSLALSHAVAIHFQDKRALREHCARGYSNVHPHDELLRVSTELFERTDGPDETIESPVGAVTVDWQAVDRLRGAINGVLAASDDGETLAIAAAALGVAQLPEQVDVPAWTHGALLRHSTSPPDSLDPQDSAERILFDAVSRVVGDRDAAEAWSPSEVLGAVLAAASESKVGEPITSMIERNLSRVRELVNVEREFEPFRTTGNALVSAKALLLMLLRIDLTELLSWPREETGANAVTRATAAMYAGRLRGLARESVELRNPVVDDMTAQWAVRRAQNNDESLGAVTFEADESGTSISIDGTRVASSPALAQDPVSLYNALDAALRPDARIAIARATGWPVTVQIRLPSDADVTRNESGISIVSSSSIEVRESVPEDDFLERLWSAPDATRRHVSAIMQSSASSSAEARPSGTDT